VTGRPSSSASSTSSLLARHQVASSPTLSIGFLASSSMRAAFAMSSLSGRMRIGTSNLAWSQMAASASWRSTLVGSERNTGPQGEVDANFMPRRTVSGIEPVVFAAQYHLVMGWVMTSVCSGSWKRSRPSASCSTEATATRTGIWSFQLLTICVMALGRPILATMTTPVLPDARA
jgi:hypothetical protein